METTQNVSSAVQEHLEKVKKTVANIKDTDGNAIQIPNYEDLYTAAVNLDKVDNPTEIMYVINSLLGRANNVGSETILFENNTPEYQLKFPQDHGMHGKMGDEWYWLACHLNVTDENNKIAKLSILNCMRKNRSVGTAIQAANGWTDQQASITTNIATVTVKMEDHGETDYYRRSKNVQWGLKGGVSSFSDVNEPFAFNVGTDSLTGTNDVLPLRLVVDDGANMKIDVTFTNSYDFNVESSFFKQGIPVAKEGTGFTPLPTPGIYYSWPQLLVTGTITVGGHTYKVDSGIGWIDHQLLMPSILDSNGEPDKTLFQKTATNYPYNGWIWQYFNLENGNSFTGSGFIQGEIPSNNKVKMVYGYFLQPNSSKGWDATYIEGDLTLEDSTSFPSICNDPHSTPVILPVKRGFKGLKNIFDIPLLFHPIGGQALPWFRDGTFNNPDGSFCAEFPVDFISDNPSHHPNGVGYLESVGFEKVNNYNEYALGVLKEVVFEKAE